MLFNGVKLYRILAQLSSAQISFISNDFFHLACRSFFIFLFLSNLRSFVAIDLVCGHTKCLMKWTFNASHDICLNATVATAINDVFFFFVLWTYTLTHELLPDSHWQHIGFRQMVFDITYTHTYAHSIEHFSVNRNFPSFTALNPLNKRRLSFDFFFSSILSVCRFPLEVNYTDQG